MTHLAGRAGGSRWAGPLARCALIMLFSVARPNFFLAVFLLLSANLAAAAGPISPR